MSYPGFLVAFSIAVVVFVLIVVFPKFGDMFARIHDQLPATTIVLMNASDFLRGYWVQTLLALAGMTTALAPLALDAGRPRERWIARSSRLPVLRRIMTEVYLVQILRVMGLSLGNGVPVIDTLRASRDVVPNVLIRRLFTDLEASVQQGSGLASGFERSPLDSTTDPATDRHR